MTNDRGAAFDTPAAAKYLGVSESYLNKERMLQDRGLPYLKIGRRVIYFQRDLDLWIDENTVRPAGGGGGNA